MVDLTCCQSVALGCFAGAYVALGEMDLEMEMELDVEVEEAKALVETLDQETEAEHEVVQLPSLDLNLIRKNHLFDSYYLRQE